MANTKVSVTVQELKEMCKQREIKGYSKKKKNELVGMLQEKEPESAQLKKVALLTMVTKQLKVVCRQLKIKGYSKQRKDELVKLIFKEQQVQADIRREIDESPFEIPDCLLTKALIVEVHNQVRAKNPKQTVKETLQAVTDSVDALRHSFVKTIVKKALLNAPPADESAQLSAPPADESAQLSAPNEGADAQQPDEPDSDSKKEPLAPTEATTEPTPTAQEDAAQDPQDKGSSTEAKPAKTSNAKKRKTAAQCKLKGTADEPSICVKKVKKPRKRKKSAKQLA
jgi:hypothetical protein